jgi:hypothetical protein
MPSDSFPEPWRSFLRDLDTQLVGPTELHCFGGFVVAQCYGLMRPTADIDILESKAFEKLQFRIFERHDLVLSKIVRNNDKDRADVAAIAGGPGLDIDVLRARYVEELRPKLGRLEREDLTLEPPKKE